MGGTAHGLHSIVVDYGVSHDGFAQARACGTALYKAFEQLKTQGICTRVAFYTNGTGAQYPDETFPLGDHYFFVYRFPVSTLRPDWFFEVLIEGHPSTDWTSGGQNWTPSALDGGNGGFNYPAIGIQIAMGFDSGDNCVSAWTGTTNFDGSDYKGTLGVADPVWDVSGGTVHVFPRRNAPGGSHSTNRESLCSFLANTLAVWDDYPKRLHVIADDDSFFLGCDWENDGSASNSILFTLFEALDGITEGLPNPCCCMQKIASATDIATTSTYTTDNGGVLTPNSGQVVAMYNDYNIWLDANGNPNNQRDDPTLYDECSPLVRANEAGHYGFAGQFVDDFARCSWGLPHYSTLESLARVVMGTQQNTIKYNLPWDGVTADPHGASDKNGIAF